jgi:hypothetical protein
MMLNKGQHGSERILSTQSIESMSTDQLTPEQKAISGFFPGVFDTRGWGFGVGMVTGPDDISPTPGRYGWDGAFGTHQRRHDLGCARLGPLGRAARLPERVRGRDASRVDLGRHPHVRTPRDGLSASLMARATPRKTWITRTGRRTIPRTTPTSSHRFRGE